ncbi:MAG TPA: ABATE domain-containing protein, partial [Thermopolyspora sp.]
MSNAELLRDFVNTFDVERDSDDLGTPADLGTWLRGHALIGVDDRPGADDLSTALTLRERLRDALRHNHDRPAEIAHDPGLDAVLAALPLRVALAEGVPLLTPAMRGVRGALARLAAALV